MNQTEKEKRLHKWQRKLSQNKEAYAEALSQMDKREQLYLGTKAIFGANESSDVKRALHVRNIVAELIESQVDSNIPQPKVTPKRAEDEPLAKMIEDMLRNEVDRLPFEKLNDQQERTSPIQGGSLFLVEWDNTKHTHTTTGELNVTLIHPKQFIPQDGIYSSIDDMDFCFFLLPQTKASIKQRYGIDVEGERESEPGVKGVDEDFAEDMVTQNIVYFKNDTGGIGRFSWVNDIELEYFEDYQTRKISRCKKCAQPGKDTCSYCGSKQFEEKNEVDEEIYEDIPRRDGTTIPSLTAAKDEFGQPIPESFTNEFGEPSMDVRYDYTKIPYYKPGVYPVLLRKNVSVFGQFLGDSDADKIAHQQNTIKKLSTKINEKLLKGGSYVTMPSDMKIDCTDEELKILRLETPSQKSLIDVLNVQPDISNDMVYQDKVYEEARQIIGVTDSFQGRRDPTATSGKAKEISIQQSAGRMESKRIMKDEVYAALFEVMFRFKLAYADEPRPIVSTDNHGKKVYGEFNRYDFLCQDEAGQWYWNDDFIFSCDTTAALASNREAMWQETRMNLQQGAFGKPTELKTLILFWSKMELLHYPGAADTKSFLEKELEDETNKAQLQGMGQNPLQQQKAQGMNPLQQQNAQGQNPAQLQEMMQAAAQTQNINEGGTGNEMPTL